MAEVRTEIRKRFKSEPCVEVKKNPGSKFIGRLLEGPKEHKNRFKGVDYIYLFEALTGGTMSFSKKNESWKEGDDKKTKFLPCAVVEGEKVSMFATKPLMDKLSEIAPGQTVELIYNGKKEGKTGNSYHDYSLFLIDDGAN